MLLLASIANPFPRPSLCRSGSPGLPSPSRAPWPQPTKDMISCRGVAKKRRRQEPAAGTVKSSGTVARTQQSLRGGNHVLRVLMGHVAMISRRDAPELCNLTLSLRIQRAQGKPGARCTRGLACKMCTRTRTRAYRFSGEHPAFPVQWFYGLYRALPGERAFLPPSPARIASRELGASIGAPE